MGKKGQEVAVQSGDRDANDDKKMQVKLARYETVNYAADIINFKSRTLFRKDDGFYHPMTSDDFARIAYTSFPGASINNIKELEHRFRALATDRTEGFAHLISFGDQAVWNMRTLDWETDANPSECVLASRITPDESTKDDAFEYMVELANGDEGLAYDMLQAIAPLFMERKPTGVIWFIGGGANGKSALVNAIYRIIGHHLTSLTVAAIEDGKATPTLNGVLGNVCRESSEGKVEDSERYKAVGTHEPFQVRKFHSQDVITVTGDAHHIFNANNIPLFSDKTEGARRRTLVIPFNNKFKADPTFEDKKFTPKFLGGLLALILEATHVIRDNSFQYKWSEITQVAKDDYDSEVNSAEAFLEHLREQKVRAFSNYNMLMMAYQNWASAEGLIPLGVTNVRRVMRNLALAERHSVRLPDGRVVKRYFLDGATDPDGALIDINNGLFVHVPDGSDEQPAPVLQRSLADLKKGDGLGKEW